METFSTLLALCVGNSPVPGEFPSQNQWHRALMFSLICAWINGWVNNREAGDFRRHRAHYDVIVMLCDTALAHMGPLNGWLLTLFYPFYPFVPSAVGSPLGDPLNHSGGGELREPVTKSISIEACIGMWFSGNIGSGKGLKPSGTKPLPRSILAKT